MPSYILMMARKRRLKAVRKRELKGFEPVPIVILENGCLGLDVLESGFFRRAPEVLPGQG